MNSSMRVCMCVFINRLVMAKPPEAVEEALEKIAAQLECSICLDTYTDPKLLPCFHTFCKKCLEPLTVQDHDGHTLCCPNCRKTTLLPLNGVSGLQTAFHIEHFFEIHATLTKAKEPQKMQCEKCKRSTATGYCHDCSKFVCDKCTELHQIWEEFASHQIASINDIQQEAANLVPPTKKVMYCPKHPGEKLKIYCETCGELTCNNCTILFHQGHTHNLISDTFPKHKEEIVSSLQLVKQQLVTVSEAVHALDTRAKEIEDQRMAVEVNLHEKIDNLHHALGQQRTELVGQLHQLTQQKLNSLSVQRDQCELVQTQLNSCLSYVEGSLKTNSEVEILAMKIPVLKQIEQITAESKPDILTPGQEADIQLLIDDTVDLETSCQGFAEIVTGNCTTTGNGLKAATVEEGATVPLHARDKDIGECDTLVTGHCTKSYVTGNSLKTATVGEGATVTLHVRDKDDGELADALVQDVNASLVCTRDNTIVKCDIKRKGKSTYTISYWPTTRGRHKLHININGKIVKGSPHTIIVGPNLQDFGNPVKVIEGLNEPCGVTTDSKGRIIVTECSGQCVSIFSPEWDKIQLLGIGSRSSTEGQFDYPAGVTVDDEDNIYVVDHFNRRVQKFSSDGRFVTSVGMYGSNSLQFKSPFGIGFNKKNGKLYVCDSNNYRIQILGIDLTLHHSFGSRGSGNGQFDYPYNIAFDRSGNVYVADDHNHRIQVFTPEGQYLKLFGSRGAGPGKLCHPRGVAISGDHVFIVEYGNDCVSVFSTEGEFLKLFGCKGKQKGQFQHPRSIHVNKDGFILVADCENYRIQVF